MVIGSHQHLLPAQQVVVSSRSHSHGLTGTRWALQHRQVIFEHGAHSLSLILITRIVIIEVIDQCCLTLYTKVIKALSTDGFRLRIRKEAAQSTLP